MASAAIRESGLVVWRMSSPEDGRSMWYDRDGNFDPIDPAVEVLPMPIDEQRLHLDESGVWLSSVAAPDLLDVWFPDGLQKRLRAKGFVTHQYFVRHWIDLPNEVVFRLDTATEIEAGDPR